MRSAVALVVVARRGDPSPRKAGTVAVLGDSLNVGVEPSLGDGLRGWTITTDGQRDASGFGGRVARIPELAGPQRCVVWPTISRGGPSDALNAVLRRAAATNRALALVEWAEMVENDPSLLAGDGAHATPEGDARRAVALAAVRRCTSRTDGAA